MTMEASVNINLAGNLAARARAMGGDLDRLGRTGSNAMKLLSSGAAAAGRGLDAMANRYTAFATGATMTLAVKKTMETERRFTRLGIAANASAQDMDRLKQGIYDASNAPDVKIDPTQLTDAVDAILEKTGDLKFAEDNLQNLARTIQATGAEGSAVGEIFAEMQKQGMNASEAIAAIDTLAKQGKEGAFTLKDLARLGPSVVTAYTALGRTGPKAMQEMGGILQVIRQGTKSSEEAATAWSAFLRVLTNKDKIKFLEGKGIKIFDKDGTMRDATAIYKEMIYTTKGNMVALGDVLDDEAKKAFNAGVGEYNRTGGLATLEKMTKIQGDGTTIQKDSARAAKDAAGAMQMLANSWNQFADKRLVGPMQTLAGWLDKLGSKNMDLALGFATTAAAILGVAVAGRKMYTGMQAVKGMFGRGGMGGGAGGVAGAMMGKTPLPVYVVNFGSGGGMGLNMPGGKGTGGAAGKMPKGSKIGNFVKGGGGAMVALGAVVGGLQVASTATDDSLSYNDKVDSISNDVGSMAGGMAGMIAGAAVGSVIPVVGTVIGGAVGGMLGAWGGAGWGVGAANLFKEDETGKSTAGRWWDSLTSLLEEDKQVTAAAKTAEQEKTHAVIDVRGTDGAVATISSVTGPAEINTKNGLSHSAMIGR